MSAAPLEWVILRLHYRPEELWVNYEDSRGNKRVAPVNTTRSDPKWPRRAVPAPLPMVVRVPADLDALLLSLLDNLPLQQRGPHNSGPVPLAIFIDAPSRTNITACENVVSYVLPPVDQDRIQLVRMPSGLRKGRSKQATFSIPLRILTLGESGADVFTQIWSTYWFANYPQVAQHGIDFQTATGDAGYRRLRAEQWDIVITDSDSVARVVTDSKKASSSSRPRLIVFIGAPESETYVRSLELRADSAFLWVPQFPSPTAAPSTREFLEKFLYGIIHDYPLHEAVKSAGRGVTFPLPDAPVLIADPISNNSLRFSDAASQLVTKAKEVIAWKRLGDIEKFIARAGPDVSEPLRRMLRNLDTSRSKLRSAVEFVESTPERVVFDQETEGLVPLVHAASALESAHTVHAHIGATAAAIVNVPKFVEEMEKHQERHVDIAIQDAESDPAFQRVDPLLALRPKGKYQVRVHIGHREPDSVMIGEVPPVDPFLPPPNDDGYHLEVALFEKDFKALSPTLKKLDLPRLGSSKPVLFQIRAPRRQGAAEARIGIYHENNLLQSFLLRANVSSDPAHQLEPIKLKLFKVSEDEANDEITGKWVEEETDKQVLTALAFTQSARFGNLGQLGRRELSIGFNEDQDPSSHTFMMKADGAPKGVNVKDDILREQTEGFRDILKANVHDANKLPVFPSYPGPGDESRKIFFAVVQQLIEKGSELYDFLFTKVPSEMKAQLGALKATTDKTIQIVKYDMNNVFPWPILYDFQLPTKIAGAPPPTICLGQDGSGSTNATNGIYPVKQCSHGPDDEVYCIYGFWGLRHQIEQLFKSPSEKTDAITELVPASANSYVRLAVSTGDAPAKTLQDSLSKEMGPGFVNSSASEDLVDLLWNDATRPAVLVVMGHLQQSPITGEPVEERIVLVPKKKWFLASLIMKRLKKMNGVTWEQPNTLVMLMACSSGATEITTLNNFVTNLNSAGAAAVVGTECLIFSSLVGRFAQEVTSDLWNGKPLGEAVKFFNRRLVSTGNPLAFAFNCLGNANLKLIKPQ